MRRPSSALVILAPPFLFYYTQIFSLREPPLRYEKKIFTALLTISRSGCIIILHSAKKEGEHLINSTKLKSRMVELGLTQRDIAKALKLAPSTVSQKISGARPMYLSEAEKLAKVLVLKPENFSAYFFAQ